MTGGGSLCTTLERLGLTTIFGLPGTQNVELVEELRRSSLRFVLATHELAASFMANGYYRASGKVGVLMTISGPGLTYAITGLAEARHDSAAVLHITIKADEHPSRRFQLQALKQREMLQPLVKKFVTVTCADDVAEAIVAAYRETLSGEPGPVVVEIPRSVISATTGKAREQSRIAIDRQGISVTDRDTLIHRINSSSKLALICGQGAADAASHVLALVEKRNAIVMTTCSGRGVVTEDHPRSCYFDFSWGGGKAINAILGEADLILALGCKFTHNGTGGFALTIGKDALIHIDTSSEVFNANYPASLAICADAGEALAAVGPKIIASAESGWTVADVSAYRTRLHDEQRAQMAPTPVIQGTTPSDLSSMFLTLRDLLPDNAIIVTDSGFHQALTRTHFVVRSPRGMICPTDFQSMGFALPAAIGAQLAAPERPVVVIIGDGGMAMSAMELVTAVRENIPLTVCVFTDGYLGLIRLQQLGQFGQEHAVMLANPDFSLLCEAAGAGYRLALGELATLFRDAMASPGVQVIEIDLQDGPGVGRMQAKGRIRQSVKSIAGPKTIGALKRLFGK